MATIREQVETCLREADADTWYSPRALAEEINRNHESVRAVMSRMYFTEKVLERREVPGSAGDPRPGSLPALEYRLSELRS